jgi:predicted RNA binding protein YcfA (HicA-like mRNA interferase family)
MSRVPVVTFREAARAFRSAGFVETRQRGSHVFFEHPDGRSLVLPNHPGRDIAPPLLRDVLNEVGISVEEFRRLL